MNWNKFEEQLADEFGPPCSPDINFYLPSGLTILDTAMRGSRTDVDGGYPGGQVIEMSGEEQTGKTAAALLAFAIAQLRGGGGIWCDAEGRLDPTLVALMGVIRNESFIYRRPSCLEKFLGGTESAILRRLDVIDRTRSALTKKQSGRFKAKNIEEYVPSPFLVCLDSVAALGPRSNNEADQGSDKYKPLPMKISQLWSDFFRKDVIRLMVGSNIYLLLLNQVRTKVDFFSYGPPDFRSPGGHTIRHHCSVRLRFAQQGLKAQDKSGQRPEAPVGALTHIKLIKVGGPPKRHVWAPYYYHRGFDDALSCLNYLLGKGYLKRKGAKIPYEGQSLTKMEWRKAFYSDPKIAESIREFTRNAYTDECQYQDNDTSQENDDGDDDEIGGSGDDE